MRSPSGKFISDGDLLSAWLPVLLGKAWNHALPSMLEAALRWCETKAAEEYRMASDALATAPGKYDWAQRYAERRSEDAARWFRRKAILTRAKAEIETA